MAAAASASDAKASGSAAAAAAPSSGWNATFASLFGNEFVNNKGAKFTANDLKGKTIGIYFSAHWCPPCRAFTPQLAKTYTDLKAAGKPFEVVFASSDQSASQFKEYFAAMPWLAVPFEDRDRKNKLSKHYKVEGIPTLVIVDGDTGDTITRNGRMRVGADLAGKEFPWNPKPSVELDGMSVQDINETAALITFLGEADAKVQASASAAIETVAGEVYARFKSDRTEPDLNFLIGKKHAVVPQVKAFLEVPSGAAAVLLDVPNRCKYVLQKSAAELTAEVVREFVAAYRAGKLQKIDLPIQNDDGDEFG